MNTRQIRMKWRECTNEKKRHIKIERNKNAWIMEMVRAQRRLRITCAKRVYGALSGSASRCTLRTRCTRFSGLIIVTARSFSCALSWSLEGRVGICNYSHRLAYATTLSRSNRLFSRWMQASRSHSSGEISFCFDVVPKNSTFVVRERTNLSLERLVDGHLELHKKEDHSSPHRKYFIFVRAFLKLPPVKWVPVT